MKNFIQKIIALIILIPGLSLAETPFEQAANLDPIAKKQAITMAKEAIALFKNQGTEAYKIFTSSDSKFHDNNMFVVVYNNDGICLANGSISKAVGRNVMGVKDLSGNSILQQLLTINNNGWVQYKWEDPHSKVKQERSVYVTRINPETILGVVISKDLPQ